MMRSDSDPFRRGESMPDSGKLGAELSALDFEGATSGSKMWLQDNREGTDGMFEFEAAPEEALRSVTKSTAAGSQGTLGVPSRSSSLLTDPEVPSRSGTFNPDDIFFQAPSHCGTLNPEDSLQVVGRSSTLKPEDMMIFQVPERSRAFKPGDMPLQAMGRSRTIQPKDMSSQVSNAALLCGAEHSPIYEAPSQFCDKEFLLPSEHVLTVNHDVVRTVTDLKAFFWLRSDTQVVREGSWNLVAHVNCEAESSFFVAARVYYCLEGESKVVLQPLCMGDIVNFHRMVANLTKHFSADLAADEGYESERSFWSEWSEEDDDQFLHHSAAIAPAAPARAPEKKERKPKARASFSSCPL